MTEHSEQARRETWNARYREADQIWSGEPNAVLVDVVSPLSPGRALDLGCGEGGDALWLASHGWRVTAVDISSVALERAAAAEREQNVPPGLITWVHSDLVSWHPATTYDLVSAFFLHSHTADIPRAAILRRAADAVAPGGCLLVVGHAAPPWEHADHDDGDEEHGGHDFVDADEQTAQLQLDPEEWRIELAETRSRPRTLPSGERADVDDVVVLARRRTVR